MSTPSLLDAVRAVKQNEREASDQYAEAAKMITNPGGKTLFKFCQFLKQSLSFHRIYNPVTPTNLRSISFISFVVCRGKKYGIIPQRAV